MPTLFSMIQDQKMRTVAYPIHERWLDVGMPAELEKAVEMTLAMKTRVED